MYIAIKMTDVCVNQGRTDRTNTRIGYSSIRPKENEAVSFDCCQWKEAAMKLKNNLDEVVMHQSNGKVITYLFYLYLLFQIIFLKIN